jgi:hypothetical protein
VTKSSLESTLNVVFGLFSANIVSLKFVIQNAFNHLYLIFADFGRHYKGRSSRTDALVNGILCKLVLKYLDNLSAFRIILSEMTF